MIQKIEIFEKIYINRDNRTVEERFGNRIQFGNLVVRKYVGHKDGRDWWECLCSCGNISIVSANRLLKGNTKSCGCLQSIIVSKRTRANLIDQRFSRLLVKSFFGSDKNNKASWVCICDCGNETIATTGSLRNGSISSCGCLQIEVIIERNTTHGLAPRNNPHPLYHTYQNMKSRCYNTKDASYPDYGGRGITMCARWLNKEHGFENFLADMGPRPEGMSLDRIDNDLLVDSYSKDNCRWTTRGIQNRNQRTSVRSANYPEHKYWKRKFSNAIIKILNRAYRHNTFCEKYIGCTVEQFKQYIESLWEPWMNWDNRDSYIKENLDKVWHIEHIKACHEFDLSKEEDRLVCFNYKNLRPYEGLANLQKH